MKHVSSPFTRIQFWVCINLFVLLFILSRKSFCYGFIHSQPTKFYTDGRRSRHRNNILERHVSSTFNPSSSQKSLLEKAGGISYRQSVCTRQEMDSIRNEIAVIMKRNLTKERSSIAQNRLGVTLTRDQTSETFRILEDGSIFELVQRLADFSNDKCKKRNIELASEIPVEVRLYEQVGASMAWHQDDVMYEPPQLELVFTLENNSDCVTMWKKQPKSTNDDSFIQNDEIYSQETHPNSLLLLLAGGPDHCVTSLKRGRRVILKCAFVYEGATYIGEENYSLFGKTKGKKNAKRISKSKKRRRNTKR